jgi:hypothetical protein
MANHFRDDENERDDRDARDGAPRNGDVSTRARRTGAVAGAAIVVAACAAGIGIWQFVARSRGTAVRDDGAAKVVTVSKAADGGRLSSTRYQNSSLPFGVTGVDSSVRVVMVGEGKSEATLADEWTFGDNYREIGSCPIDGSTVFGSYADDPDNLLSYQPGLIKSTGAKGFGAVPSADDYYEPQDGTGDASHIMWRSARVSDSNTFGVDDWQVSCWDAKSGKVRVFASAEQLNGRGDTPSVVGEVVPTADDSHAYFSSNVAKGDSSWECDVLAMPLDGGDVKNLGDSFPAALRDGVAYASGALADGHYAKVCTADDGSLASPRTRLAVQSGSTTWGVTGVWASHKYRAVSFSPTDDATQTYVGLWSGDFKKNVIWLQIPSGSVVASMNDSWFVWGQRAAGEQRRHVRLSLVGRQDALSGHGEGILASFGRAEQRHCHGSKDRR